MYVHVHHVMCIIAVSNEIMSARFPTGRCGVKTCIGVCCICYFHFLCSQSVVLVHVHNFILYPLTVTFLVLGLSQ